MNILPLQSLSQIVRSSAVIEPSRPEQDFITHFFLLKRLEASRIETQNAAIEKRIADLFISSVEKKSFGQSCASYVSYVNEVNPYLLKYHLEGMEEGWIVSVGGLRCMFNALLAPEDRFQGICIVDQDPAIVYAHRGLILLFMISKDASEARDLLPLFRKNPNEIINRIDTCCYLSAPQKEYYRENLSNLADHLHTLLSTQKSLRPTIYAVKSCNKVTFSNILKKIEPLFFMHKQESFAKLQRYAKEGKICAFTGNIYDLKFLKDLPIAVVDESNCHQYSPMYKKSNPILIEPLHRFSTVNPVLRILTCGVNLATNFISIYDYADPKTSKTLSVDGCRENGPIGYHTNTSSCEFVYTGKDIEIPLKLADFDKIKKDTISEFEKNAEDCSQT